jgi:hypothetical protein
MGDWIHGVVDITITGLYVFYGNFDILEWEIYCHLTRTVKYGAIYVCVKTIFTLL